MHSNQVRLLIATALCILIVWIGEWRSSVLAAKETPVETELRSQLAQSEATRAALVASLAAAIRNANIAANNKQSNASTQSDIIASANGSAAQVSAGEAQASADKLTAYMGNLIVAINASTEESRHARDAAGANSHNQFSLGIIAALAMIVVALITAAGNAFIGWKNHEKLVVVADQTNHINENLTSDAKDARQELADKLIEEAFKRGKAEGKS